MRHQSSQPHKNTYIVENRLLCFKSAFQVALKHLVLTVMT